MAPMCFILTRVKVLFQNANYKLQKIFQWLKANKLSVNEGKTKFTLLKKLCDIYNLPFQFGDL